MFRRFSVTFAVFSMVLDGLIAGLVLRAAEAVRPLMNNLPGVATVPTSIALDPALYYLLPVIWVGLLLIFSVYDGRKNLRVVDEYSSITAASGLALVAMAGVLYLSYRDVSRALFLSYCLATYLLLIGWRAAVRLAFRWGLQRYTASRRVLIIGAGEAGRQLGGLVSSQPHLGLELAGYLDDDPAKRPLPGVIGSIDDLRRVVVSQNVADVVVALPRSAHKRLTWVVGELHTLAVKVWIIPDYFSLALNRASVEEFAGVPMLDLRAPALSEYQRIMKRAFDLVVSILLLPFLALLGAAIAVAIRLDSPGPIFYYARRVGENGRIFSMVKFRTMVENAEALRHTVERRDEAGNLLVYKTRDDPRVTRVGRYLRRTSLDELPQLINVLRGDMSLVGPRPELPDLVDQYQPWQRKRFAVPQGVTGWWQIHGRSDKPMHLHTEEDLYYVQHYSIWLDLQILLQTAWAVLRGKGAY